MYCVFCGLCGLCVCLQYAVTLTDFYDLMLSHQVSRNECFQVALQMSLNKNLISSVRQLLSVL